MQAQADSQDPWIADLARFAHDFQFPDVSQTVRHRARFAVRDTIGCILACAGHPDVEKPATAEQAIWVPGQRLGGQW